MTTLTLKKANSDITQATNLFKQAQQSNNKGATIAAYTNLFLANVAKHRLAKTRKKIKK